MVKDETCEIKVHIYSKILVYKAVLGDCFDCVCVIAASDDSGFSNSSMQACKGLFLYFYGSRNMVVLVVGCNIVVSFS